MEQPLQPSATPLSGELKERAIAPPLKGDRSLWGIYLILCLISIVELYSASAQEVDAVSSFGVYGPLVRHGIHLTLGFLLLMIIQSRSYTRFIFWGPMIALLSIVLMILVLKFGKDLNGAKRSINLFVITVYPSEFIKLSAAMVIALIMAWTHNNSKNEKRKKRGVILSAGVALCFGGLLCTQGLTNFLLLMGISLGMMVIGGVKWKHLGVVVAVYIVTGLLVLGVRELTKKHHEEDAGNDIEMVEESGGFLGRFSTWTNRLSRHFGNDSVPKYEQPVTDINRQEMYGYMAQAHGGVFGVMPGNSRETERLPLAVSDYIYAVIVEEWGLIGGLGVLTLYLWLLARASRIASRCNQRFAALLVIGMAVMIVLQALFHMAIVTGVFPVSGQPLPLISKGGTSILVTSIAFGVMLSVSRFGMNTGRKQDERDERESLPENLRSANPNQL